MKFKLLLGIISILFVSSAMAVEDSRYGEDSLYRVNMKWQNSEAEELRLDSFSGKPVVITMAYSTCRFSCPLIFAKLREIEKGLKNPSAVHFVVVSLKPEEDNPERLSAFKSELSGDTGHWHLLTGSATDTRKLSHLLGINYQGKAASPDLMHSNVIHLLDSKGAIVETAEGLSADVTPIIEAANKVVDSKSK